ncbi:MAG: poly(3-hydroxybutyrate) depolymerase [Pseudomonadota bacterium]
MLDSGVVPLPHYDTQMKHSISGLSSGAFMTVQMHIAHSALFVGAGVIAGGPYRAAETFRGAAPTKPLSCILNSLYIAMTPLTASTAPDVDKLVALAKETPDIDKLDNLAGQRLYIFTGTKDRVVNQHAVRTTVEFYKELGVDPNHIEFVQDVPAGHSIITMNPEDSDLDKNQPPYINRGTFIQSHDILDQIYDHKLAPAADHAEGDLIRFDQSEFYGHAPSQASMAPFAYAYIPSQVRDKAEKAIGVHIVMHGCKQGYDYTNFVNGKADILNQPPYGDRYITTTGYMEKGEANNIILLFPQVGGDDNNAVQNPDGCWDWWGYSSQDEHDPDYYSQKAVQIHAIYKMLKQLGGVPGGKK